MRVLLTLCAAIACAAAQVTCPVGTECTGASRTLDEVRPAGPTH